MDKKYILLFFLCAFSFINSFAQVSVNPLTGTGSVVIPIYTLSSGQVSVPVSLVYHGTGVKPKDVEGTAGIGWGLQGGGRISRQVRGLPDDCIKDSLGNQRLGWMSILDTAANKISTFTVTNNGGTCSNETADISYINANFPFRNDTEPDLFYVNAPGLSCEIIYDRAGGSFRTISYEDLVITYTTVGGTGNHASSITSFTITNDKGIKYVFAAPEMITQITSGGSQNYFKTKYLQYANGITYASSWNLTKVTDANGNGVILNYTPQPTTRGADSVALYIGGAATYALQYRTLNTSTPQRLGSIVTTNVNYTSDFLSLHWTTLNGGGETGQTVISSITGANRNLQFTYSKALCLTSGYARYFLRTLTDPGCGTPINYQFSYLGESPYASYYQTTLPDSSSTQRDYWGYYSSTAASTSLMPKVWIAGTTLGIPRYAIYESNTGAVDTYPYYTTNGNIRAADPANVMTGSLNKIVNAQGGSSNIVYESNDYLDLPSGAVVPGGGIRVKQIIDSIGKGSTNNIIHNYSYINPVTGLSSGKPVSLPLFAFTIPYSGALTGSNLWNANVALSAYDLSDEDHSIMYEYTKASQAGAGSSVNQYFIPATNWDNNAKADCNGCTTNEWAPVTNYVARNNCSSTYGPVNNIPWSYPFIPNPNYDFERGLPIKSTSYNDNGVEVSESNYTYQRSFAPLSITAFKFDDNVSGALLVKSYNKYNIFYNTSELNATVINKVYDSPTLTVAQSDTTTYTYGSSNHKQLTQLQKTNSDRSVVTNKVSYVKDYGATSGSNPSVTAIYNLKQQNINIPLESYQQVTRSGVTKTTSASLTLFKGFTPGTATLYLPSTQFKMIQPDGLTGFSPLNISGQTLTYDSLHYIRVANYTIYDNTGFPQTVDDNNKNIRTTILDHLSNKPTAIINNAAYNEIAFSDFDSDQESPQSNNFSITGSGYFTPTGSHAGTAYGLGTAQTVAHTVTKNAIAQNYIFSIWINSPSSGSLSITLDGGATHTALTYTNSSTWKYYELKLPVSSLPSSFTVSFTTSLAISIDDILFYPDVAEATTVTYDGNTHYKIAETNTNGISNYFNYDQWGRLLYAYDQDKNIVQKNSFLTPSDVQGFNYASISIPSSIIKGTAAGFGINGPNACSSAGATVTWHFGDTTSATTSLLATASHTYASNGKKVVTATVTSPMFGTFNIGPDTVTVSLPPIPLTYHNNSYSNGNITNITITDQQSGGHYSFTPPLNGATLPPGRYTIVVTLSGGTQYVPGSGGMGPGYGAINLSSNSWTGCSQYVVGNTYTFSADLTNCTGLDFAVYEGFSCGD
jgi:hypothetical protein